MYSMLWRIVGVAAILAGLAWGYHVWADHQREIGRVEVRTEWRADKLARAESTRLLLMAKAKTDGELQAAADIERKALNDQNRNIGRQLADSLERLRNRPERPEPADRVDGVPEVAGAGTAGPGDGGCTGSGLFRSDSEFLTRIASSADRLRIALRSCRAGRTRDQSAVNSRSTDADPAP